MSSHLDSLSDEILAKKARDGDQAAFEVLCDRYLPRVFRRLSTQLPSGAAEDVTQEVFVAAVRAIKRYRGQALFRTWIGAIARHKVADFYRKQGRQPAQVPLDGEADGAADPGAWQERVAVRTALQRLPAHYQEVLLLRFAEGMPFRQAADTLGISLEATKSRYRRAVAAIAQEMGADLGRHRDP